MIELIAILTAYITGRVVGEYQAKRQYYGDPKYADWREQLAMLYDDMIAGKLDSTGTWAAHVKAVKDANPKP